jgi:hypothetical protein
MNIEVETVKDLVVIDGVEYYLTPKTQLETLLTENKEFKTDFINLKGCILKLLDIFGILDSKTNTIKEKIKTGEESYFKHILKALKTITILLVEAKSGFSKRAEAELDTKFDFIKVVIPLIDKHKDI